MRDKGREHLGEEAFAAGFELAEALVALFATCGRVT
jgi:hypothetical protein